MKNQILKNNKRRLGISRGWLVGLLTLISVGMAQNVWAWMPPLGQFYFTPSTNWATDDARFQIHTYVDCDPEIWAFFTLVPGTTDVYEVTITPEMIACGDFEIRRMHPTNDFWQWNNVWNGGAINWGSNNYFQMNSGFSGDNEMNNAGSAAIYTPPCSATANAGANINSTIDIAGIAFPLNANDVSATPNLSGEWSIVSGGTGAFSDATAHNSTFTPNSNNTYVLRWTVTNSAEDCSVFDDMRIILSPVPSTCHAFIQNGALGTINSIGWASYAPTVVIVDGAAYFDVSSNRSVSDNQASGQYTVLQSNPSQNPPNMTGGNYWLVFNLRLKTGKNADNICFYPRPDGWPEFPLNGNNSNYLRWIKDYDPLVDCADTWIAMQVNFPNANWFRIAFIDPDDALLIKDFYICPDEPTLPRVAKSDVTLSEETCNSIKVEWTEVAEAVSYEVYRCTSANINTCFELVHTEDAYTGEFVDTELAAGAAYYYMVKVIASDCHYSTSVIENTATTGSLPSPIIVIEETGPNSFLLTFTLVEDAESYTLYRSTDVAANFVEVTEYTGTETFIDNGLAPNTIYYYKLVANFDDGCLSYTIKGAKTLENFGVTTATCGSDCYTLVGFTNFAYNGATPPARWNVNQIRFGGVATQQITMNNTNYVQGGDFNPGYAIVPNPTAINANCMDTTRLNGGWSVIRSGQNPSMIYRISGLNPSSAPLAERKYCVRVKMRVLGNNAGAYPNGTQRGNNSNVDLQTLGGSWMRAEGGRYITRNPWYNDNQDGSWVGENEQRDGNRYCGSYMVFEGTVTISDADGFQIRIKTTHQDSYIAVESIEVYGCVPKIIDVLDTANNLIARNPGDIDICETEEVTLRAVAGFGVAGEEIVWTIAGAEVGTGETLSITAPAENTSVTYTATGSLGSSSVKVHGKYCCHTFGGEQVIVHAEYFNEYDDNGYRLLDYSAQTCAGKDYADIPGIGVTNFISSRYTYAGSDYGCTSVGCGNTPANNINDCEYAVVKNAQDGGFWPNFPQHTQWPQDLHGTSGMLLVNAATQSGDDYFYSHTLTEVCANTRYEISVWYANVDAVTANVKPNIALEVWPVDADGNTIGAAPLAEYITGEVIHNSDPEIGWKNAVLNFVTNEADRYMFKIKNNVGVTTNNGNDIAIDDIVVKKCVTSIKTVDFFSELDSGRCCTFNPEDVVLSFPQGSNIQATVGNGGDVWVQWAYSPYPNGPWIKLTDEAGLNDTIHTIEPIADGQIYYYVANISADKNRAEDLSGSAGATCGNDVFSKYFMLLRYPPMQIDLRSTILDVEYNEATQLYEPLRVCQGTAFNLIADPSDAATKWCWSFNDTTGMVLSSNEADKSLDSITNAQPFHEGMYYFYVKNDGGCDEMDSIYVVVVPAGTTYYDTICDNEFPYSGEYSSWFENITAGGVHTATIGECEFYLDLKVNPTYSFESDILVSDRLLPYIWTGHRNDTVISDAGIYYDSLKSNFGCDSIYRLDLRIKLTDSITIVDTVCGGSYILYDGREFTTTTFIVDELTSSPDRERDTILNLSVWIGEIYDNLPINFDHVCSGMPYNLNGFDIAEPETRTYERHLYTTLGCDSIIRLDLTVNEPIDTTVRAEICKGETYSLNGIYYTETFDGINASLATSDGCDSIVYLNLTVNEKIIMPPIDTVVCGTAPYSDHGFYFEVPETGTYQITLPTSFGCDSVITLHLEIEISLIEQKWNDVIAVLNQIAGGYDFEIYSFQWYKNGEAIAGATNSYLYVAPDVLDTTAIYYVLLTTSNGVVRSCPLKPRDCTECPIPQVIEVSQYPSPQLKTSQAGVATMYNVQGILVGSQNFEAGTTNLLIPVPKGMYILRVVLKDGYSEAFKIVVSD